MRKLIFTLITLLSCNLLYPQQPDLESLNKKELISLVSTKEKEINKLKIQIAALTAEKVRNIKLEEQAAQESEQLKNLLTQTTNRWLQEVFIDKYITNENYFLESNIPENNDNQEELNKNFDQYDIIIRSVLASNPTKEHQEVAERALDFNQNYLTLLRIREEIIPLKYNEDVVAKTLHELDTLPKLQAGKLQEAKNVIIGLLKNYKERNCMLKLELDNFSKVDQEVAKAKYKGFENDPRFNDYPYFLKILQDIQKNVNLYTSDSLPCITGAEVPATSETLENPEAKDTKEEKSNKIIKENKPELEPAAKKINRILKR